MGDVLTFVDECFRRSVISLFAGEDARGKKRAHAQLRGSCRSCKLQQSTQPVPAFGEILANLPIAKQGGAETQAPFRISGFCQPLKRRAKIVMFSSETLQPFCPLRPALLRSLFFSHHQAVRAISPLPHDPPSPAPPFFQLVL